MWGALIVTECSHVCLFDMESDTWDLPSSLSQSLNCDFTSLCRTKKNEKDGGEKGFDIDNNMETLNIIGLANRNILRVYLF